MLERLAAWVNRNRGRNLTISFDNRVWFVRLLSEGPKNWPLSGFGKGATLEEAADLAFKDLGADTNG
jgi:hypothetical protein